MSQWFIFLDLPCAMPQYVNITQLHIFMIACVVQWGENAVVGYIKITSLSEALDSR